MGYGFSYNNNSTAITVTARPLSVAADAASKIYGGTDPALTYQLTSGTFYGTDAFTGTLARATGEAVASGPYAIMQNTLSAGSNYTINYTGAGFTITPASLVITADDKTRQQGQANPLFTASYNGLQNNDHASAFAGLTFTTSADRSSAPGSYDIIPGNAVSSNYSISYNDGTLDVTPRVIGPVPDSTIIPSTVVRISQNPNPSLGDQTTPLQASPMPLAGNQTASEPPSSNETSSSQSPVAGTQGEIYKTPVIEDRTGQKLLTIDPSLATALALK